MNIDIKCSDQFDSSVRAVRAAARTFGFFRLFLLREHFRRRRCSNFLGVRARNQNNLLRD